jgi:hypothetical protein
VAPRPQARAARRSTRPPLLNATTATLIRLYYWEFAVHSAWVLVETGIRLLAPLALREFLRWLQRAGAPGAGAPVWVGWMWALAVAACGAGLTLTHHVFFWIGMRLGYVMRQQVVAAIHAKVLRLNSASVAYASTGAKGGCGGATSCTAVLHCARAIVGACASLHAARGWAPVVCAACGVSVVPRDCPPPFLAPKHN